MSFCAEGINSYGNGLNEEVCMTALELSELLEANAHKKSIVLRQLNIKHRMLNLFALAVGVVLLAYVVGKMQSLWPHEDATLSTSSLTDGLLFVMLIGFGIGIAGMLIPFLSGLFGGINGVQAATEVSSVLYPEQNGIITTRNEILRKLNADYLNDVFYSPEHKQSYIQYGADTLTRLEQEHVVKNLQIETVFFDSLRTMALKYQGISLEIEPKNYEYKSVW